MQETHATRLDQFGDQSQDFGTIKPAFLAQEVFGQSDAVRFVELYDIAKVLPVKEIALLFGGYGGHSWR